MRIGLFLPLPAATTGSLGADEVHISMVGGLVTGAERVDDAGLGLLDADRSRS